MKRIVLIFSFVAALASCKTGKSPDSAAENTDGPYLYLKEEVQELGKVKQGDTVFCTFVAENRGKADLIIKNVVPGCGCTVAKYEEKPIPPKKSGIIKLIFATTHYTGKVHKVATIYSNAKPESKRVEFKCEVLPNK